MSDDIHTTAYSPIAERIVGCAPTKINLTLSVTSQRSDSEHDVDTIMQAIDAYEYVELRTRNDVSVDNIVASLRIEAPFAVGLIPHDEKNLAWQAVNLVAQRWRRRHPHFRSDTSTIACRRVDLIVYKQASIASGLAGACADAAAAIVAARALFPLSDDDVHDIATELGGDVAFCLRGGTVRRHGRAGQLQPLLSRTDFHWALGMSRVGLRGSDVIAHRIQHYPAHAPQSEQMVDHSLQQALIGGDVQALGSFLHNDLQPVAISILPALRASLHAGERAGALGSVVCGSGPTLAFLCRSREHAVDVLAQLCASGTVSSGMVARGPVGGAHLISASELEQRISGWRDAHRRAATQTRTY